jgi:hypothetical protein
MHRDKGKETVVEISISDTIIGTIPRQTRRS